MKNFNYFKATEIYRDKYYQLPRVFFENEDYISMSNDAKVAYTLLKARFDISLSNNWIDQEGNVYFIYTVNELMDILNCREGKVSSIKKELISRGLLYQKRSGACIQNGIKKNLPNKLYLGKPDVNATDVYVPKGNENTLSGIAKIANPEKVDDINDNHGIAKIANPGKRDEINTSPGIAKIANNIFNNNILDTNRHLIDTDRDQQQDQILLDSFVEIMKDESIATFIPERVLGLIKAFSSSYAEAQQTVRTIHNAKKRAQKETGQMIAFEDVASYGINADAGLYNTLIKAYQKQKTEQVENLQNLIFVYVKNWFIEKPIAQKINIEQSEDLPEVSLFDWASTK